MNNRKSLCLGKLFFLLGLGSLSASADNVDVYLIAGQSNATGQAYVRNIPECFTADPSVQIYYSKYLNGGKGSDTWTSLCPASESLDRFGIELSMGTALKSYFPERRIAIIKHALSGSNLFHQWNPGNREGEKQGAEYTKWLATVKDALSALDKQGHTPVIRAMVWHQGEGDALKSAGIENSKKYGENLNNFIKSVRSELGIPNLPFIYGKVMPMAADRFTGRDEVRQGQMDVATSANTSLSVPHAVMIDCDGLQMRRNDYLTPYPTDDVHLGTFGILNLGERYAQAIQLEMSKQSTDVDSYKKYSESLEIGTGKTWSLPNDKEYLKKDLDVAITQLEKFCNQAGGNIDSFEKRLAELIAVVEEKKTAIEEVIVQPIEYHIPQGLCFNLVRTSDNKTLMLSTHPEFNSYCVSFEDKGKEVTTGKGNPALNIPVIKSVGNDGGAVPQNFVVTPVELMNKWDETHHNYYFNEVVSGNALRLNDALLYHSKVGSADYYSKSRIKAFHITSNGELNIQGAEGGYTDGQYFRGEQGMERNAHFTTYWKLLPLKRVIAENEKLKTLTDFSIPVEMNGNAQMRDADGKTYEKVVWKNHFVVNRWHSVYFPSNAVLRNGDNGEMLALNTDFELMQCDNGHFLNVSKLENGVIPQGAYVLKMINEIPVCAEMNQVNFSGNTSHLADLQASGNRRAENMMNFSGYRINSEGTAFEYVKNVTLRPFEGYFAFSSSEQAVPIKIESTNTGIEETKLPEGFRIDSQHHKLIVGGSEYFELWTSAGVKVVNASSPQQPGVYVLKVNGISQIICL